MTASATPKRRKPPIAVSDKEIVNAIYDCHGNLRVAADKLKIAYGTLLSRMKHIPEAKRAKEDAIADMVEIAEDNVYNMLLEGNEKVTMWVLERRDREKWGKDAPKSDSDDYPEPEWEGDDE